MKKIELTLDSEIGVMYTTTYSLIDYGDGIRCAWCKKLDPTRKHLESHDLNRKKNR